MFSGGEDGFARMWDVAERKLKMSYCVRNSAINCSDFSVSGDVIAVGLSKGGFLILDSDTLLPQAQVVFEFEVLVISEGNDVLSCTTSTGPLSESDRVLLRKLDRLKVQQQYLDRGKGQQTIPEESLLELEKVVAEIQAIQDTISSKQKRFFNGSFFSLDSLTSISRRRSQIAELKLARFSGLLSKPQHRELVTLENQEQQQQRLLISDIDLNLSQLNCLVKFASPSWNIPSGRATVQKFDEEVKHSKRSILVVKFSPDNRMLAVAGVDMIVYVHQVLLNFMRKFFNLFAFI
jgi:WD40 repeat protein